ncbi:AraC family transcriptional regulator [Pseudohalioglobus sediminis]|uniref:AraC family transcriptional regulator n=1 Tax=Pseudohalioglobus sediminis TaxID=2606449 RepID=A0A5B0X1K6_9GAMM|nr:AraC family transcriptional regulator [Pseudohalioglobus sediminis]KAA1193200.1 AraC family transcriptional regulator [Pseudohalioglobus sediminis]
MEKISPVYARLILREVVRRDINPAPLFCGASITREQLLGGGDISMADFLHILRTGHEITGDDQLGFILGRNMPVFALGEVGAGMAVAPTLREGLQLMEAHSRLHASYVVVRIRSTFHGLTASIGYHQDTDNLERFHTETAMLILQRYAESLLDHVLADASYRLTIAEPDNSHVYRSALHGSVSFAAAANEVDIPRRWLDLPSPYFHPELWRQACLDLSRRLADTASANAAPYSDHVAALLRSSEPPLPDLVTVASSLCVSERTLNRRLQQEGQSFRQLKTEALAARARHYLRNSNDSIESIAATLGYQDTANFRRAFRNNEGCTPNHYRQRAQKTG